MRDDEIASQIKALVSEEHRLERAHGEEGLNEADQERMRILEVQLDQLWDLLRQRRARRNAGLDPDDATTRDGSTVEGFLQ